MTVVPYVIIRLGWSHVRQKERTKHSYILLLWLYEGAGKIFNGKKKNSACSVQKVEVILVVCAVWCIDRKNDITFGP